MVLVLCIGDLHIPHRTTDIPQKFKELLKPGKIHQILCTGNLCCKSALEFLKGICGDVKCVQGDFDDFESPEQLVVQVADFKVGVCHGHQVVPWGDKEALAILQRQLGVDILVTGHTHEFKNGPHMYLTDCLPLGAYSTFSKAVQPSFVLMDLDGSKATIYVYQLVDGEVQVEKIDHFKQNAGAGAAAAAPV
eukprot:gene7975-8173_t